MLPRLADRDRDMGKQVLFYLLAAIAACSPTSLYVERINIDTFSCDQVKLRPKDPCYDIFTEKTKSESQWIEQDKTPTSSYNFSRTTLSVDRNKPLMALLKYTSKTNTDVLGMTHKRAFRKLKTISNVHDDSDTHFLCFLVYPIDCELTDGNALFPCESYCRNISSSFKYNVSEVCDMLAEKTSANEFCINERTFRRPEPSVTESQVPRPVVTHKQTESQVPRPVVTHKQTEILKMPSCVTFTMPVVSLCVIMLETLIVSLALSTSIGSHQRVYLSIMKTILVLSAARCYMSYLSLLMLMCRPSGNTDFLYLLHVVEMLLMSASQSFQFLLLITPFLIKRNSSKILAMSLQQLHRNWSIFIVLLAYNTSLWLTQSLVIKYLTGNSNLSLLAWIVQELWVEGQGLLGGVILTGLLMATVKHLPKPALSDSPSDLTMKSNVSKLSSQDFKLSGSDSGFDDTESTLQVLAKSRVKPLGKQVNPPAEETLPGVDMKPPDDLTLPCLTKSLKIKCEMAKRNAKAYYQQTHQPNEHEPDEDWNLSLISKQAQYFQSLKSICSIYSYLDASENSEGMLGKRMAGGGEAMSEYDSIPKFDGIDFMQSTGTNVLNPLPASHHLPQPGVSDVSSTSDYITGPSSEHTARYSPLLTTALTGGTEDDVPKPKIEDTQARKQDQMPTTTARNVGILRSFPWSQWGDSVAVVFILSALMRCMCLMALLISNKFLSVEIMSLMVAEGIFHYVPFFYMAISPMFELSFWKSLICQRFNPSRASKPINC